MSTPSTTTPTAAATEAATPKETAVNEASTKSTTAAVAATPMASAANAAAASSGKPAVEGGAETATTTTAAPTVKETGKEPKVTKKMLKEAEQELYNLLLKKKQLDRNLISTESAIYDFETSYFESSGQDGNIVHGFEGYLNTGRHERRQFHFTDADRIFSQSSATFKKAQEARITAAMQDSDSDSSVASSGVARGRKHASGGGTIKHNRHGSSNGRGTPTPGARPTKKIKLSIDGGS